MKKCFAWSVLILILAGTFFLVRFFFKDRETLVIRGGRLIDGTGRPPVENTTLLIRGGQIVQISPGEDIKGPFRAQTLDARGKTIIPGLIDMHVHLSDSSLCPLFLCYGVTAVRDMGNDLNFIIGLRNRIEKGEMEGPTIFASGYLINDRKIPYGAGEFTAVVKTPVQARRAVAVMARSKADWIKVYITLPQKLLRVVLNEAAKFRLPVAGHLRRVDAEKAAIWGIKTLEHATGIAEALIDDQTFQDVPHFWTISPLVWPRADRERFDELAELLADRGVAVTANLTLYHSFCLSPEELRARGHTELMPDEFKKGWENYSHRKFPDIARYHQEWIITKARLEEFLRLFHDRGGIILAGTDTPWPYLVPGISLHEELELLVAAGLSPMEALLSATLRPAEILGRSADMGTLEQGKRADLVILDADPLQDIRHTRRIHRVIKGGRIFRPMEKR